MCSRRLRGISGTVKKYLIVIEETGSGYLGYSPDMPWCVSSGRTRAEAENNLRHALVSHLQELLIFRLALHCHQIQIFTEHQEVRRAFKVILAEQ